MTVAEPVSNPSCADRDTTPMTPLVLDREAGWQNMASAKKDGSVIWAVLRDDLYPGLRPGRPDLERWNGLHLPIHHPGLADDGFDIGWSIAAPVGNGGFPDAWFAGWRPLPPPADSIIALTSQAGGLDGWQDIATLKLDGSKVMVGHWFGPMQNGKWQWYESLAYAHGSLTVGSETHWRPLPAPPAIRASNPSVGGGV